MIDIDVRFDDSALRRQLGRIRFDVVERSTVRALNRAATSVRAEAVKAVRKELALPAKGLRRRFVIDRARRGLWFAKVRARDYDPPLSRFRVVWARGRPVGASVAVPGRGLVQVPGAFVARTSYGRDGVFRRVGPSRYPIKFLRASDAGLPTVGAAVLRAKVDLERRGAERFRVEFERDLRYRLGA